MFWQRDSLWGPTKDRRTGMPRQGRNVREDPGVRHRPVPGEKRWEKMQNEISIRLIPDDDILSILPLLQELNPVISEWGGGSWPLCTNMRRRRAVSRAS